ncbi:MAG: stage III sporulation protein AF [Clostridia bacterium]|nr:stage III sporulation protein AF [Clostridia bacterium]
MASIADWVRELSLALILAGVADLFIPDAALKRTARLAVGIVVVALVLAPLLRLAPLAERGLREGLDDNLGGPQAAWGTPAAGAPSGRTGAGDLTEQVFVRMLEERVSVLAAAVDGVARAEATVALRPGDGGPWGRVGRVDVRVWAEAAGAAGGRREGGEAGREGGVVVSPVQTVEIEPVRVPPAAGEGASAEGAGRRGDGAVRAEPSAGAALAERVRSLLARELGLPAGSIRVTVVPAARSGATGESSRPAAAGN